MELYEALSERLDRWVCVFRARDCRAMYANVLFLQTFKLHHDALDEMTVKCLLPDLELVRIFSALADGAEAPVSLLPPVSGPETGRRLRGRVVRAQHPAWGSVFAIVGEPAAEESPRVLRPDALARLSHALRGPLHVIVGFAELLGRAAKGEVSLDEAELLADIIASAQSALLVVEELNTLAVPLDTVASSDALALSRGEGSRVHARPRRPALACEVADG